MFDVAFIVIVLGCGVSSFLLGRKAGIVSTVGYLIEEKILELDDIEPDEEVM